MRIVARIIRRMALETRAIPDRWKDFLLTRLSESDRYRRGMIDMGASLLNMRQNGFTPTRIIDVGAFRGDWSRMARGVFPGVSILMLDANPDKDRALSATSKEIGEASYRIALLGSQRASSVPFYLRETGSSVLPENTSIPGSLAQLPMTTLDDVLQEGKPFSGPFFLKLDVQGFELEVLRGAAHTLAETEAALLEVSLLEYNVGAPLFAEVVAFMQARGFVVYDVCGFYRRESDLALYMLDLLFVRETSALRSKKRFWNLEARFEGQPQWIETAASILVTGASGFVGRHIVYQLSNGGYRVRALMRRAPLQSFGPSVEVVLGDLNHPETYREALKQAGAVVHAALSEEILKEPHLISTLVSHCVQAGVRAFIHLSSIAVYGNPLSGVITEATIPIPSADRYARVKLAAEEAVQSVSAGMELTILRLGCVYGPGGGWWTQGLLQQMQRGKVVLVDRGAGIANLIHVSDVGSIVPLVLRSAGLVSGIFNVTDAAPVEWSRYFAELEKLAGKSATVSMTAQQAREHGRKWIRPSLIHRAIRKLTGAPVIFPLDDQGIVNFTSRAVYSNHKAVELLGFAPEYDLETGMRTVRGLA